ncbi:hypothetical protein L6164_013416 [Bauhinia variegata]|uniref:Uncharacterized protein n=1 Tax=Bauhinia variegata TaxID=167791 RepID=A0ACB9NEW2_BAUVA|nr:hypothetical protein L6164_013416 [Bauhinia variegata]
MHDLIQEMGREIVRQKSPLKPGEWSRLWFYEDILHVLEENMGTDMIEFIMLELPKDEEVVLVTWLSCFTNLEYLKLSKNTYTDEFLCEPLPFFGNLEVLDLTATCIKQCRHLRTLVLNNCHQLETITEIPTSIKDLSAMGCRCLNSPSSRILLSQKLHEDGGTYFILPGSWIPEWFHHHWHGSSLSFWFREKFPSIALYVVHLIPRDTPTVQIRLNSHEIDFQLFGRYSDSLDIKGEQYVSLFDLGKIIQSSRTDVAEMKYRKNGWNHVEVEYIAPWVMWIGVHVYKQKTNIENVRFTSLIGAKKRKRAREHILRSPMK